MDPRYRFTLVMSCLLVAWWVWEVVTTFLIGPRGLNLPRYQNGIVLIGCAVLAGFLTVWLAATLAAWQRRRKTGFEADTSDEFGTQFQMAVEGKTDPVPFAMTLSKFQPALLATPLPEADLHPLEAELFGFLHGYRHWPLDPSKPEISLYEQALARWQIMQTLPRTTHWHRVAALAKDLCVVAATRELRTVPPRWKIWARDSVSFRRISVPNPGMSALLLSTLPAFRAMDKSPQTVAEQRALLTALRYHTTPHMLPTNAHALAPSIVEALSRAEAQLGMLDIRDLDDLTPARKAELADVLPKHWLTILAALTPADSLEPATQLYAATDPSQPGGVSYWLSLQALMDALGPHLSAELRTTLHLWDAPSGPATQHPGWSLLGPVLQELELICTEAGGIEAEVGTFTLAQLPQGSWGPALLVNLAHPTALHLKQIWAKVQGGPPAELVVPTARLAERAQARAAALESQLQAAF